MNKKLTWCKEHKAKSHYLYSSCIFLSTQNGGGGGGERDGIKVFFLSRVQQSSDWAERYGPLGIVGAGERVCVCVLEEEYADLWFDP